MSTVGVCRICEVAEATNTCEFCGSPVCDRHYDHEMGVCQGCLRGNR